jgi:hypothetical protein
MVTIPARRRRIRHAINVNPYYVVSAIVNADNPYIVVVTFSKNHGSLSNASDLSLNVDIDAIESGLSNTYEITVIDPITTGQELLLSYTGTGIVAVDNDVLQPFSNYPVTNNIV